MKQCIGKFTVSDYEMIECPEKVKAIKANMTVLESYPDMHG